MTEFKSDRIETDEHVLFGEPDPIKINHIVFVLDKSGSMAGLREQTVNNFNEQLQELKKDINDTQVNLISLITFAGSTSIEDVRASQPLSQFEEIKLEDYKPIGGTALYDAIAHAVMKADMGIEKYKNFDNAALIVILSDGGENASKEFDNHKITDLIKNRQDSGKFTFTFMGCGEVVRRQAFGMGIPFGNTTVWQYSPESLGAVSVMNYCSTKSFQTARNAGFVATSGFYQDPLPIVEVTGIEDFEDKTLFPFGAPTGHLYSCGTDAIMTEDKKCSKCGQDWNLCYAEPMTSGTPYCYPNGSNSPTRFDENGDLVPNI
jgi:uncharacterized protein YegL